MPVPAADRPRRMRPWAPPAPVLYGLSLVAGLVAWELVAGPFSRVVLAPPSAVLRHLSVHLRSFELPALLIQSLGHMLLGYGCAIVVAVPLGFLIGRSERAFVMCDPIINALYAIPSIAFVPFLVIWCGLFFWARAALVFLMCVFDILVTVAAGARNVPAGLLDVGRAFGASGAFLFRTVLLPASLPFLFTAFRLGLVRALVAMVTAELFFAAVNLGAYMQAAANRFDSAGLLAVLSILALWGLGAQEGLKALEVWLLPWHGRSDA
ncbi:MAG TPA: ABC transporter permease [Candidatus Sulfotelmatobacter sp.]|nr:ABC transporter permease [Candidatus Sulfotelmatobacter sp.]